MDEMNYFPTAEMEHDTWVDVSSRNFCAIVEQTTRGPFIQVPTNGLKTRGIYLVPDKNLREVNKGELVKLTKVCLKSTFGFFRSVPVSSAEEAAKCNFLHMGYFTENDMEDTLKTEEQQETNT